MKVPYIILSLGGSALLLWQCFEILNQNKQTLMHDIVIDIYKSWAKENDMLDSNTVYGKKYGYFLQLTDTHVKKLIFTINIYANVSS